MIYQASRARGLGHFAGHRRSISVRICSAYRIASAIALIVAGTRAGASYCASFRAARMAAAISSTRFRPSSIPAGYHIRFSFAIKCANIGSTVTDEETIDFQERDFTCPYCGKETVVESPMDTILMGRAICERCGSEFLIENDVPTRLPY